MANRRKDDRKLAFSLLLDPQTREAIERKRAALQEEIPAADWSLGATIRYLCRKALKTEEARAA